MHIRVNDTVEVRSGDDRGIRGKVLRVDRMARKVVVEGVNRIYKHVRRSQRNPQGGRLSKEMPVSLSAVSLICEACSQTTRTGARFLDDGSKERYCKKCGTSLGAIAPRRTAYAKNSQ